MSLALLETIDAVRSVRRKAAVAGQSVGFVPTMGALHQGHARLIEVARRECDLVIVSVFVNPLQFDRQDDLNRYPRTLPADLEICAALKVDAVFAPGAAEMYPRSQACVVHVTGLTEHLCGAHRPGHFDGVATVVLKLFEIVQPTRAYFGDKDAQQLAIIRRMVADFNLPTTIVGVPTVREPDGLAMSSRNRHLNPDERAQATALFAALSQVKDGIAAGRRQTAPLIAEAVATIPSRPEIRVEYLQVVDPDELQPLTEVSGPVLVAGAMWIGATRLIDNVLVIPQD